MYTEFVSKRLLMAVSIEENIYEWSEPVADRDKIIQKD